MYIVKSKTKRDDSMSLLNKIVLLFIKALRPLVGYAECRYMVTCTQFAEHELREKGFLVAIWGIVKRVVRCNPFF